MEEQYIKLEQLDHVLLRPQMYIGSVDPETREMWSVQSRGGKVRFGQKELTFVPGIVKIFDELLVNAIDNKQRDSGMSFLEVAIDGGSHSTPLQLAVYATVFRDRSADNSHSGASPASVLRRFNNGKGIPIEIHRREKLWVPELVFGELLTGSNFDDNLSRLTGGRHGFGAKLTNIFSNAFTVETVDVRRRKWYRQTWKNNMRERVNPIIIDLNDGHLERLAAQGRLHPILDLELHEHLEKEELFITLADGSEWKAGDVVRSTTRLVSIIATGRSRCAAPPQMHPLQEIVPSQDSSVGVVGSQGDWRGRDPVDYTLVTCEPDLSRFEESARGMAKALRGTHELMQRRVYDAAGCLGHHGVDTFLGGKKCVRVLWRTARLAY